MLQKNDENNRNKKPSKENAKNNITDEATVGIIRRKLIERERQ